MLVAIKTGSAPDVQAILNRGLDANTVDREGYTLLMLAIRDGNADIVDVLLSAKANPKHPQHPRRHRVAPWPPSGRSGHGPEAGKGKGVCQHAGMVTAYLCCLQWGTHPSSNTCSRMVPTSMRRRTTVSVR